ncbi:HD domain-containing phosphohydrolase [Vibrio scophthalmi]|uniref:Cyclic di-GMP phosphodiesterase response regulator RpfG n=1 Tax=Vibrio scophthalmi TaxID=45658 RepID=A0A1C7FFD1_9VIBR|nr:HD domain-containing phosphohydrolase [Vibrio scophthalmi]ANU38054.1 Cyclic di-GMP phosphodiesterase response regulator RpfG [Vibrio scophthalmi]
MQLTARSFPIHIHITTIIIVVVVLASGIQIWLTNNALSEVITKANSRLFERIATETKHQLNSHYSTAFTALGSFTQSHNLNATAASERIRVLPEVVHLLSEFPHILAYSFVFPDGDAIIVKRMDDELSSNVAIKDPRAQFLVTHHHNGLNRVFTLSEKLELIEDNLENQSALSFEAYQKFAGGEKGQNIISKPTTLPNSNALGIHIYRESEQGLLVFADVRLDDLRLSLNETLENTSSIRVLYNDDGSIFAFSDGTTNQAIDSQGIDPKASSQSAVYRLEELNQAVVSHAIEHHDQQGKLGLFEFGSEQWFGHIVTLKPLNSEHIHLLIATRANDLFDDGLLIKKQTIYASLLFLITLLPCIYLVSNLISKPIIRATNKAKEIENFRFDDTSLPHSYIKEIQELNHAQMSIQATISRFISLTDSIARKQDLDKMLELVCRNTGESVSADGVFLYLLDAEEKALVPRFVWQRSGSEINASSILVNKATHFIQQVFINKQAQIFKLADMPKLIVPESLNLDSEVICIPLKNRAGQVIGSFSLLYEDAVGEEIHAEHKDYLEILLGYVSVAIETHEMMEAQRALLDSFIQVFAGSLDKKSPYTGNHCQRVPILTQWLTQAAQDSTNAPFDNFSLTEQQWQELKMASWLHDCGKITTPEHVVDKSTKLEAIYDRIHEVRMRFEVLKRDREIALFKQLYGELPETSQVSLRQQQETLDNDFAFVAKLNIGGEFVSDSDLERLKQIGDTPWTRTLSKRIGISWVEQQRFTGAEQLPQQETLLSDLPEHIVEWDFPPTNEARFSLKPTQHKANMGEYYNLSIRRGTLTDEERFIINDHIIQTIIILESLPFPKHMQNVAKIAGGHHEKIDGTGYPMGLKGNEMPPTARVMAIADVFEALTSADRPYKKAKSLSESLKIMHFMVKDQHLDKELFELFLTSGIYKRFAHQYMKEEQIDKVDIEDYIDRTPDRLDMIK